VLAGSGGDAWAQQSGAQTAPPAGAASTPLGPVTVEAPATRRRSAAAPKRMPAVARTAAAPRAVRRGSESQARGEDPRGAVTGYAAGRSMTGTKTNTPLLETPQAISVIGSEQIRDQKPDKLDEVLRYAAGVYSGTFGADTRNDWFLIRGFKSDDNSTFLDGLQLFYTSYASWKLQPFNMERVEVLRGPSAVLYGGSSPSGMVNVISKTPPTEPIRYLETGINSYGNSYLSFDLGGPVAVKTDQGQLFYRLVGQLKGGDTQTDYIRDDNYFIAPSLTWKPDADTSFTLLASASKTRTNGENFLPYIGTVTAAPFGRIPTSFFSSDPSVDYFKREQEMIGYQFERHLSDSVSFRQNARFGHVDVDYSSLVGLGYANATTGDLARGNFRTRGIADQADLDSQLEYRFATGALSHTALFGLDLKHYRIDDVQGFGFGIGSINVLNPVYAPTALFSGTPYQDTVLTQKQLGLYAQDQIKWDRWTLVLSGRNDWVSTDNDNRIGLSQSRDDSRFSGRAGLIYTSEIGLAPYVSYATSYNPIIGINRKANQLFLPETGQQTEIGVKFAPAGMNGYVNVAWFDLKRQNALSANPDNVLQALQSGEVTSRGLELEAVANLTPGFKVIGSFTTYHLFVSKDPDATLIGLTPTNTPQQLASLWMDYTLRSGPLTGLGFGAGVRYVGESFADQANTLVVPARGLGDLAVHYEWDNWRAALNVANIADKTYVASCASATSCFYGDRRRATASLSYRW
jgi:iron complex outermembrane recepter protein